MPKKPVKSGTTGRDDSDKLAARLVRSLAARPGPASPATGRPSTRPAATPAGPDPALSDPALSALAPQLRSLRDIIRATRRAKASYLLLESPDARTLLDPRSILDPTNDDPAIDPLRWLSPPRPAKPRSSAKPAKTPKPDSPAAAIERFAQAHQQSGVRLADEKAALAALESELAEFLRARRSAPRPPRGKGFAPSQGLTITVRTVGKVNVEYAPAFFMSNWTFFGGPTAPGPAGAFEVQGSLPPGRWRFRGTPPKGGAVDMTVFFIPATCTCVVTAF